MRSGQWDRSLEDSGRSAYIRCYCFCTVLIQEKGALLDEDYEEQYKIPVPDRILELMQIISFKDMRFDHGFIADFMLFVDFIPLIEPIGTADLPT